MLFLNFAGFVPSLLTSTMDNPIQFNVEIWSRRAATLKGAVIILKQIRDGMPPLDSPMENM